MSTSSESRLPPLPEHPLVFSNVLELIGDTPLIEIRNLAADEPRARVFGKFEALNPGGSVKDRICLAMLLRAEREGRLAPSGTVVEPTSGNTGIGLALVCASRGYRCVLTMPESMSLERRQLLESFGAEVVLTPEEEQMDGAIARARRIVEETKGAFMPQQFENSANPEVHAEVTAQEILHALGSEPVHAFVAAVGTGGTVSGVGRVLRERFPGCRVIAVEPESCATISRGERGPSKIQGIAAGFVPKNYDARVPTEVRTVTDERAYRTKQELARREGLLVGISSGANVAIALDVARELGEGKNVVTVLCDTGERYFSLDEYFTT
ncbi:MAG TPA: cysteine synthase A [Polyangiaceae bacterium]|nr:MAG: cysteine synthase A [Pseudomonadota bacterium]HLV64812.1 cysteine synthase A [Polyangiaceae bacterium]